MTALVTMKTSCLHSRAVAACCTCTQYGGVLDISICYQMQRGGIQVRVEYAFGLRMLSEEYLPNTIVEVSAPRVKEF